MGDGLLLFYPMSLNVFSALCPVESTICSIQDKEDVIFPPRRSISPEFHPSFTKVPMWTEGELKSWVAQVMCPRCAGGFKGRRSPKTYPIGEPMGYWYIYIYICIHTYIHKYVYIYIYNCLQKSWTRDKIMCDIHIEKKTMNMIWYQVISFNCQMLMSFNMVSTIQAFT